MANQDGQNRPAELDSLRAPSRDPEQSRLTRERILARAEPLLARRRGARSPLEILATWARPGLVAAAVALLVVIGALRTWGGERVAVPGSVALEEALSGAGERDRVPALLVAVNEPDADAVVAAALSSTAREASQPDRDNSQTGPERR